MRAFGRLIVLSVVWPLVMPIVLAAVVVALVVGVGHLATPASTPNPEVFVVNCSAPGSLSYEGRQGAAARWIARPGRAGQCWITEPLPAGVKPCHPSTRRTCPLP